MWSLQNAHCTCYNSNRPKNTKNILDFLTLFSVFGCVLLWAPLLAFFSCSIHILRKTSFGIVSFRPLTWLYKWRKEKKKMKLYSANSLLLCVSISISVALCRMHVCSEHSQIGCIHCILRNLRFSFGRCQQCSNSDARTKLPFCNKAILGSFIIIRRIMSLIYNISKLFERQANSDARLLTKIDTHTHNLFEWLALDHVQQYTLSRLMPSI